MSFVLVWNVWSREVIVFNESAFLLSSGINTCSTFTTLLLGLLVCNVGSTGFVISKCLIPWFLFFRIDFLPMKSFSWSSPSKENPSKECWDISCQARGYWGGICLDVGFKSAGMSCSWEDFNSFDFEYRWSYFLSWILSIWGLGSYKLWISSTWSVLTGTVSFWSLIWGLSSLEPSCSGLKWVILTGTFSCASLIWKTV